MASREREEIEMDLAEPIKVFDNAYVKYIDHMGSDQRIVEAARMSNTKGFLGWGPACSKCGVRMVPVFGGGFSPADYEHGEQRDCDHNAAKPGDEKLLKYLYENKHATPFEMCVLTIEVEAPIFVFREWHRHRTQSYNEMSARYTPLPDVNYVPTPERCLMVSKANKQAGAVAGADELTHESAIAWLEELQDAYTVCERVYQSGLRRGIPKELARLPVPVARNSRMMATANLRNWLAFMTLRSAQSAMWEIRQCSGVGVAAIIKELFPRTWELFALEQGLPV